jgi:CheY-like chemotaxis protein
LGAGTAATADHSLGRELRDGAGHSGFWLILLTGAGEAPSSAEGWEAEAVMSEPIQAPRLLAIVAWLMDSHHLALMRRRARPATAGPSAPAEHRLLLVEDNRVNQKLMVRLLAKFGYPVDVSENGEVGLERVREATVPYSVILMDCQMPVMDGYEAAAAIRRIDGPRGATPIIAMTAHAMTGDREKCLAAGMDDSRTKPVDSAELRRVLRLWTRMAAIPTL